MDTNSIDQIIEYLCNDLGGDWFLTGGALVRLQFDSSRGTEDVDLVRISHPDLSDEASRNQLFKWLLVRGSGPEWVNNTVEPFVKEVPDWQHETVLLRSGLKGRVYRPNLTLFVYLKLRRATDIDLEDIRAVAPKCEEGFDFKKFESWASSELKSRFKKIEESITS